MTITITGKITGAGKSIVFPTAVGLTVGQTSVIGGGTTTGGAVLSTLEYNTISSGSESISFGNMSPGYSTQAAMSNGSTGRGIWAGGTPGAGQVDVIRYITITSLGDAADFGDLRVATDRGAGASNGTGDRGIIAGGWDTNGMTTRVDKITISSGANSVDYGTLAEETDFQTGVSNGTNDRGVSSGGRLFPSTIVNKVEYISMSAGGAAVDIGDLSVARRLFTAASNDTNDTAVWFGGFVGGGADTDVIDHKLLSNANNATSFGILSIETRQAAASSNGTDDRAIVAGGTINVNATYINAIDYVTITSTGNSIDFGELITLRAFAEAVSDSAA